MMREINPLKLTFLLPAMNDATERPYVGDGISAGFPSPADDWKEEKISLDLEVVGKHASTVFYVRVDGHSMENAGISDQDIIVVDKVLDPQTGDICVCIFDGEFTVKRLKVESECVWLLPENENYPPILIEDNSRFEVWGVVTHTLKYHRRK